MIIKQIPFQEVPYISEKDLAYAEQNERLRSFFHYEPSLDSFSQVAQNRNYPHPNRQLLVNTLEKQYKQIYHVPDLVHSNIQALREDNVYTIITAHQPSIFGGPLYFIYKALSTIRLCQQINEHQNGFRVVPIFVIGGEDHDFEEINHINIFGKKITWSDHQGGPIGRYSTSSLEPTLKEIREILGTSPTAQALEEKVLGAYREHHTFGIATMQMINNLLGHYGLIVTSMDEPEWKRQAVPIFLDDLTKHSSYELVGRTQQELEKQGFKPQAYVRPVNLFYLSPNIRERIEKNAANSYTLIESKRSLSLEEISEEIHNHPEHFSPNVILRPLYQELIFPNLAYVGGGGELSYWMERKEQFEYYGIDFPVLIRRDSVLWCGKSHHKKMKKLSLDISDFLEANTDIIINQYLYHNTDSEISIDEERSIILEQMEQLQKKAALVDPTLKPFLAGETKKIEKLLDQYAHRIKRAEKNKNDISVGHIQKLKEELFPQDGLQERYNNFMEFYLRYGGDQWFDELLNHMFPTDMRFKVFIEEVG